jgi:dTDP-4-dehydrorhamnose 3,5-epimerase
MEQHIKDVVITPLKRIEGEKGSVYHGIKKTDAGFAGFEEAYFSTVNPGTIKGWKKHYEMTMNLVVPQGTIKFVLYDDREGSDTEGVFQHLIISPENYCRLTVPPKIWMAFEGLATSVNLLMNVANMIHDPNEQINLPLDHAKFSAYAW